MLLFGFLRGEYFRREKPSTSILRVGLRFGNTSIIPLAQQPVNDPECDYRETQSDNSQRGCHLNIEDDEFSRQRQNADEYDSLDLDDAVKTFHCPARRAKSLVYISIHRKMPS